MVPHLKKSDYQKELISLEAFLKERKEYLDLIRLGQFIPINSWKTWKDPWGYSLFFGQKINSSFDEEENTKLLRVKYYQSIEKSLDEFSKFLSCKVEENHLLYLFLNDYICFYENGIPKQLTKYGHSLPLLLIQNSENSTSNKKKVDSILVNNFWVGSKLYFENNYIKLGWSD